MDCFDFDHLIAAYFASALSQRQLRDFQFHLKTCEDCSSYLKSYWIVISLLREERLTVT